MNTKNKISAEIQNGNLDKPMLEPVFDFQKGDVVEFCDEEYFVIENNGSTGVVNPFGVNFYVRNFYWKFQDTETNFVRKPTLSELDALGLK
jgi:hypothetical protein